MDEAFSVFIEEMGEPIFRQEAPHSSIDRYEGKLPNKLLEYWSQHGWCGYGEGIFWTVNPQEYEGVVASWLEGSSLEERDTYHLIARSVFGDLYLFGEHTGFSLNITAPISRYSGSHLKIKTMDKHIQNFFLSMEKDDNDFDDLFEPAKKKLGIPGHDEMFAFVPAITLGGRATLEHLEKVKTIEHLMLLSQIAQLKPYSFSDF
ncbi:GAD-like domain-containing protein [Pseudomonas plecoglossicida]|uniref:GAD-like domain-containing protein n=1 Tax=Pseudomonas plecoglossicida TaxID=70775 RepID=UPI003D250852